jgi:hypothetical protein
MTGLNRGVAPRFGDDAQRSLFGFVTNTAGQGRCHFSDNLVAGRGQKILFFAETFQTTDKLIFLQVFKCLGKLKIAESFVDKDRVQQVGFGNCVREKAEGKRMRYFKSASSRIKPSAI